MKLVEIPPRETPAQVLELAREILARAERGEIRSLGIALVLRERHTGTNFALDYGDAADLYLALHDLAERIRDSRDDREMPAPEPEPTG